MLKSNLEVAKRRFSQSKERLLTHDTFQFVCELSYEPVWYGTLMFISYIYSMIAIIRSASPKNYFHEVSVAFFYVFDAVYAVDIILTIGEHQSTKQFRLFRRPNWVLMMEVISVVPFELGFIYWPRLCNVVYSLHSLRIARILYYYYYKANVMEMFFLHYAVCFCAISFYFAALAFFIIINVYCLHHDCDHINHLTYFCMIMTKLSTWGFSNKFNYTFYQFIIIIYSPPFLYFTRGIVMGLILADFMSYISNKFRFRNMLHKCKLMMDLMNVPKPLVDEAVECYNLWWEKNKALTFSNSVFDVFPDGIRREVRLDMYCVALKHSKLFRDCDLYLMRYLTSMMTQKFYYGGEVIYLRGEVKKKLIYIVSGVVEVITDEDDDTPLMSFTSGTCLGEISLLIPQLCTSTVRCKDFVEFQELRREDFLKIMNRYPEKYRHFLKIAKDRYAESKRFNSLVDFINKQTLLKKKRVTIIWLRKFMKMLLDGVNLPDPQATYLNELEGREVELSKFPFKTTYIDLLALTEKSAYIGTEVIRSTFPYIFHPNSLVIKLWDTVILVCIAYTLLITPRYMFRNGEDIYIPHALLRMCNYFYMFDILVQLSTAVVTKHGAYITHRTIANFRIKTLEFQLDIFAAIPLEMLNCITLKYSGPITDVCLKLNRMLKIWKAVRYFQMLRSRYRVNFFQIAYVEMTLCFFYLTYVADCMLYASACSFEPHDCKYAENYLTLFSAVQIVTGVGLNGPMDNKYHFGLVYLVISQFCSLIFAIFYIFVTVFALFREANYYRITMLLVDLEQDINKFSVRRNLRTRMNNYIEKNWQYNEALDLLSDFAIKADLPHLLYKDTMEQSYWNILRHVTFFENCSDSIIYAMSPIIYTTILPANEIVCYAGDMSDRLIIIKHGQCELITNLTKRTLKRYDVINPLVFVYRLQIMRTCITTTDCVLLLIPYDEFILQMKRFELEYKSFVDTVSSTVHIKRRIAEMVSNDYVMHTFVPKRVPWFNYFGRNFELDSLEEYEYHVPFDELDQLEKLRHFLMRLTINPNGKFCFVYEILRAVLSVVSAFCHSTSLLTTLRNPKAKFLLYGLDATAYLDIYIKMHVAYFDVHGILITHPLKTFKHYVKHSFVIDLLAVFPFEVFYDEDNNLVTSILHMNRILQLYRYHMLLNYMWTKDCRPKSKLLHFHIIPSVLILLTILTSITVNLICKFNINDVNANVTKCTATELAINSTKVPKLTGVYVQLHTMYLISSALNAIGFNEVPISTFTLGFYLTIATLCGNFYIYYLNHLLSTYCAIGTTRQSYIQCTLGNFRKYMKKHKVSKSLEEKFVSCVKLKWQRQRGKKVVVRTKEFHFTLKQDIIFDIYGQTIINNNILQPRGSKFFRNLLHHMKHNSFPSGICVTRCNDVCKYLYIIHRGSAMIRDANGKNLQKLYSGGMFGNLHKEDWAKMMVECVPLDDMELMYIPSTKFYSIMENYPLLIPKMRQLLEEYQHYLPSKRKLTEMVHKETKIDRQNLITFLLTYTIHPDSRFMLIWRHVNVVACCISFIFCIYQIALHEFNSSFVLIQHICDIVYIVHFFIQNRLLIMDLLGNWVYDIAEIKRQRKKDKGRYVRNILACLPLDLWIYLTPFKRNLKERLFKVFRINRLMRVEELNIFYAKELSEISRDPLLLEMSVTYIGTYLSITAIACSVIAVSTWSEKHMGITINDLHNVPGAKKFKLLIAYMYVSFNMIARMSDDGDFPVNHTVTIILTVIMCLIPVLTTWVLIQSATITFNVNFLKAQFRKYTDLAMYFLEREEISEIVVKKAARYINVLWLKHQGILMPKLVTEAPRPLYEALCTDLYMSHIDKSIIFKECSHDFKRQLVSHITTQVYFPSDYVTFKKVINHSMYFIDKGEVLALDEDSQNSEIFVKLLDNQSSFGTLQGYKYFLPHKYTYKAKSNSEVLCLKYNDWKHLVNFFPEDEAKIEKIYQRLSDEQGVVLKYEK